MGPTHREQVQHPATVDISVICKSPHGNTTFICVRTHTEIFAENDASNHGIAKGRGR